MTPLEATIEHATFTARAIADRYADGAPRAKLHELATELREAAEALQEITGANR